MQRLLYEQSSLLTFEVGRHRGQTSYTLDMPCSAKYCATDSEPYSILTLMQCCFQSHKPVLHATLAVRAVTPTPF